jgi:hypothetical protein
MVCRECNKRLSLEYFLPEDKGRFYGIRFFLHKHRNHKLMLLRWRISPAIDPAKHLDRSTPQKRCAWLTATRLLLNALIRIENENNASGAQAIPELPASDL